MNWNEGTLSSNHNTANMTLSAAQKEYFAKAREKSQTPRQSKAALEFSELDHVKKYKLAAQKSSHPSIRADRHATPRSQPHADSSKTSPASLKEGIAAISSLSTTFPVDKKPPNPTLA